MKLIKLQHKQKTANFLLIVILVICTSFVIANLTAPKIPLMGFHGIINNQNPEDKVFKNKKDQVMNYPEQDMSIFLESLLKENFWFLSSQDLYDYFIHKIKKVPIEHLNQRPIMLSFDDGYKTIYTNLLPILEKLENKYYKKIKIVLFINPGTLADYESKSSIHLTCKDLREGFKKGFYDIQSHGLYHKKLTQINNSDLNVELSQAQIQLRQCIAGLDPHNQVAKHIAYPYGASNRKVEEYAAKYYSSGYLYNSKMLKLGWLGSYYEIPRLTVNRDKSPNRLLKMAERALKLTKKSGNWF